MRALLTYKEDETLVVTEVLELFYNKEDKHLYISGGDDDFIIYDIEELDAADITKRLYLDGKVDMSMYKAEMEA